MIQIADIRIDGGTQARAALDQSIVADYGDAFSSGATFPAVVVFFDGKNHWLADGFHRYFGAKRAGLVEIAADIHKGTQRDAILYSVGANASHGLRRTNADKRQAVETLLRDTEWSKWSDREISRRAGVSFALVATVRAEVTARNCSDNKTRTYTDKHGNEATMNVSGQRKAATARSSTQPVSAPSSLPASQQAAPANEPEDDDGPSAADLLDDMQKELARAEARVAELEKLMQADGKEAAANLARRLDHAVRQQEVLQEDAARLQRKADRYERMLAQIGKAIGQPDLDGVVEAVRAHVRATKAAAC